MNEPGTSPRLPKEVIEAAIQWAVKLDFSEASARTRADFERWHAAAHEHAQAWARLQSLKSDFDGMPGPMASGTLEAAARARASRRHGRRTALKAMLVGGITLGSGWQIRQHTPWQRLVADTSTQVGERRDLTLPDGTQLVLNTDTAISTAFHGTARIVVLHRGEIAIDTGPDAAHPHKRPFLVQTPAGVAEALGTRFVVRLQDDGTLVSVQEDAVALRPAQDPSTTVAQAGEDWWMNRQHAQRLAPSAMVRHAWVDGVIAGTDMRLADVLAELARYRHLRIRCAPEVAELRVSGTYHTHDVDQTLQFLAQTLPIRVNYWTRFWANVEPA